MDMQRPWPEQALFSPGHTTVCVGAGVTKSSLLHIHMPGGVWIPLHVLRSQAVPVKPGEHTHSPVAREPKPRLEHSASACATLEAEGWSNQARSKGQVPDGQRDGNKQKCDDSRARQVSESTLFFLRSEQSPPCQPSSHSQR